MRKLPKMFATLIVIGIMYGVQPTAVAQQKMSLTIDKAVELGLANSKLVHASKAKIGAAEAKTSETSAGQLPSLTFQGGYSRLSNVEAPSFTLPGSTTKIPIADPVLDNIVLKLSLQQPIFTGFRLESATKIAQLTAEATRIDLLKDKSDVAFAIKSAYWNMYKAFQLKKVNDDNVVQVQAHLKDVESMERNGVATNNDVLKVKVQLSDAKLRQIDAKNMVLLSQVTMNNYLGQPLTTEIELVTNAQSATKDIGSWESSMNDAKKQRPEVQAAELRMKAGEEGITMAKSSWYPQIALAANYNLNNPNQRIFPLKPEFTGTWDVGINVSMNIWNWGVTNHQTTQAELQVIQAQDAIGQIKEGINVEVTQSYLNLTQMKEKVKVAQEGVAQAEENLRLTNEKFKNGVAISTDVLDADFALLSSKTNYTNAVVDVEIAEARLQKALGEE
ncbi:MAG: TolC family protein [Bacteroidetes bacterium]|nr:TolC family protein [Bacteroidota bacterium]